MAFSAGRMSTNPLTEQPLPPPAASPAPASCRPGGAGSEDENLAVSLMMLSRGVRDEPLELFSDVAATARAPDVPAGIAQELALVPSQAPATPVTAASQTPVSVVATVPYQSPATVVLRSLAPVFAPRQVSGPVPVPVVNVVPGLALEQVVAPRQAPALVVVPRQAPAPVVLASTQGQEPMSIVAPNKAPKPVTAPRKAYMPAAARPQKAAKTVAPGSQAPEQDKVECPVCKKMFNTTRGLNTHMKCHPDGRLHPCEFCMSTFPSSSALRSHVRRSEVCGGNNRRRLGPVAAAAIAWHKLDLNMPEI